MVTQQIQIRMNTLLYLLFFLEFNFSDFQNVDCENRALLASFCLVKVVLNLMIWFSCTLQLILLLKEKCKILHIVWFSCDFKVLKVQRSWWDCSLNLVISFDPHAASLAHDSSTR